jgi:predicted SAM-dependent methyltransferase
MNAVPAETVKSRVLSWVPSPAAAALLGAWRRYYWWNKTRISPSRNRKAVGKLLGSGRPIQLELGSWRRPGREDWTFSDLGGNGDIQLDLTQPIPLPNDCVSRIYSSHLLEHFQFPQPMLGLLGECHRILKPEGEFSIAVPNARLFLEAYLSEAPFQVEKYCNWDVGLSFKHKIDYVNFIAHLGGEHKHLFDADNLVEVLTQAGFRNARIRDFDPSLDLEQRRDESIYAVAIK